MWISTSELISSNGLLYSIFSPYSTNISIVNEATSILDNMLCSPCHDERRLSMRDNDKRECTKLWDMEDAQRLNCMQNRRVAIFPELNNFEDDYVTEKMFRKIQFLIFEKQINSFIDHVHLDYGYPSNS